jgi:hypothetical protein
VEVTAVEFERRRGLRRWLGGSAFLSVRAALFLALSTFLCGCVTAGLLFVGVWRHAATEQAQAQAAQQSDRQQLLAARRTLADLKAQLARDRRVIVHTQRRTVRAASALAQATKVNRALVGSLSPGLQELIQAAATLASQTDTMQSELNALETYLHDPGAAGLDADYLATQVRYLARSAAAASSAAVDLARHTREAQSTFSTATQSASQ